MRVRVLAVLGAVLAGWWAFHHLASASARQVPSEASSPFLLTRWTTENGLPQNSVAAIAQTPDGYLWLATFGGLARFDGIKFTIFNTGNTPALPSNRITALHAGRDGSLWIGTETGEITRFHHGEFSIFARIPADATGNKIIRTIYEDRAGVVWVGADIGGLRGFAAGDSARVAFYDERHGVPRGTVLHVIEDREGRLWVCTTLGLSLFQEGRFTVQLIASERDWLINIRPHRGGGLWALTQSTLSRFHDGHLTPYLHYPNKGTLPSGLTETAAGELLFSDSTDRLFKIAPNEPDSAMEIKLGPTNPLPTHCMFEDRDGNLWMGTIGDGLVRLRRRRVTMLNAAAGLPDTGITCTLEDPRGDLWIGTGKGLCRLSGGKLTTYFTPAERIPRGGYAITALHLGADSALWFGNGKGIVRYQDGRFTEYPLPQLKFVSAIAEDRQGRMWLGTFKGLARFQDGKITLYRQSDGLVNDNVQFIFEDQAGALWLGTPGGVSRFQDGVFTNFTTREGLSNDYVRAIHEDRDGSVWIGTYGGGLNRLQNGQITRLTTKQGLFDDFISRLLVDENDDFWLLGNRGIFRVSRQTLQEFAAGQSKSVTCVVYNEADGMSPNEGQGGYQPAGWRASDGRLYFPTIRGLAVVDPSLASLNPPPVNIERVLLDGQEMDFRRLVEIPPGTGNLEIHYTGLSLGKPDQVRFSFKLSGQNENWVDVGQRRTAYFPQLQPGSYRFSVKAFSPDGVWSEREASLTFLVRPHFWQTAWFVSLVAMGLAGLALAGYRWRVALYRARIAQQEAFARQLIDTQERERVRIAAELHDGLSQSLVIIKNRAVSSLKSPGDHERAMEQLREIAEASTQTIDEVKDIIYDLHPLQLDQLGLTVALGEMLGEVAETHGLEISSELDDIKHQLPKELANSVYRIVQESLNNTIKHAKARKVAILLKLHAGFLALTIKDDGQGFVPGEARNGTRRGGFGLTGIVERVRLLGGESLIESAPGCGTTISVRLPFTARNVTPEGDRIKTTKQR